MAKLHKGVGWKFNDQTTFTVSKVLEYAKDRYFMEVCIFGEDHEYILEYTYKELIAYVDRHEVISMTFNNWVSETTIE